MPGTLRYPQGWARVTWKTWLLAPLSLLFGLAVATRRALYRLKLLRSERLSVPVIVVGNISVGGTGKTPLVLWLAARLQAAGYQPGIISRGYGGKSAIDDRLPRAVLPGSDASEYGDEPILLARQGHCPVWVGQSRPATARALLDANSSCDLIISDDGLQHYRLARDVEIAVVDTSRGHGNGWLLPAGPLREPVSRLSSVDAIVLRGSAPATPPHFSMTLQATSLRNLHDARRTITATQLQGQQVHAVAGIGNPQQFFDTLTQLGVQHVPHAFADHHAFTAADVTFDNCDAVVMTEKDAVKCERFADERHWALQAEARVDDALADLVLARLKRKL